jgi:NAD(P)-dependent dehydrogenase (short-subunit alcohol dehydrogenase family)
MDTVLITGAGRGLGLELARQYAADGWRVLAAARRASADLDAVARAHDNVSLHALDVTDHRQVDVLAVQLGAEAIDVLISNAGILGKKSFDEGASLDQAFGNTDYADWERIFRTNVMGPMKVAEAFVEHVARSRQRKIVTFSSMLGSMNLNTTGGLYGYRASKAAVNAIMKSMAVDLGRRGILAAAVHPGWVRTDMGGRNATLAATAAVRGVRRVIDELGPDRSGCLLGHDGAVMDF